MRNIRRKVWLFVGLVVVLVVAIAVPALGAGKALSAKDLKMVTLVHYDGEDIFFGKPPGVGKPAPQEPDPVNNYYELLDYWWERGSRPVQMVLDPDGAPEGTAGRLDDALNEWDNAVQSELFYDVAEDPDVGPSLNAPDFKNTISFRVLAGYPKALAVTYIWYLGNSMLDTDIVFNAKYTWAIDPEKRQYDVCNVGTHELGHVVGLDDLYEAQYRELTMYGYSAATETLKITLEEGDKLGAQARYGP